MFLERLYSRFLVKWVTTQTGSKRAEREVVTTSPMEKGLLLFRYQTTETIIVFTTFRSTVSTTVTIQSVLGVILLVLQKETTGVVKKGPLMGCTSPIMGCTSLRELII